jgi:hypothetical protein
MAPLIVLIFWMGIFPNHFLDYSKASIDHLVRSKDRYQLTIQTDPPAAGFVKDSALALQGGKQ